MGRFEMKRLNLVIGAAGHLGNNLVRGLLERGERVRASVRDTANRRPFEGLNCELIGADILKRETLPPAMEGADVLYIAAAAYKSWAVDVKREIIDVNIEGTKNILEAAAASGIKKTVYVSTTFTLDHHRAPMDETGWGDGGSDPYRYSKTIAEKTAWEFAERHGLSMVSVLPSGMVGPNSWGHLTPTMEVLHKVLNNQLPFDPGFSFSFVDVRDVCDAMIAAAERGRNGRRYILAQELPMTSTELFELAHSLYPSVRIPPRAPYALMYVAAALMEWVGGITKKKPLMLRSQVEYFHTGDFRFNVSKARKELGFIPRPARDAVRDALAYLTDREKR
jgi:dihydroflavonol-4-reductase